MHEMSLAQALVDQVIVLAEKDGYHRILSVDVSIGALSGVMRESLEFCFPVVARSTPLESAVLNVTEIALTAECAECGRISNPEPFDIECCHCGSMNLMITKGRDFKLISFEVE